MTKSLLLCKDCIRQTDQTVLLGHNSCTLSDAVQPVTLTVKWKIY